MVSKPLSWLLNGNRNAVICSWLFMNQDGCSRIRRSLSRNSSDKLRKWRCRISKHGQNLWCFNIHNKRALALANALLYFEENQMSSEIYLSAVWQQKLELSIKASFSTFFLTLIFTSPADLSLKKKPLTYKWIIRIFVSPCPYQSVSVRMSLLCFLPLRRFVTKTHIAFELEISGNWSIFNFVVLAMAFCMFLSQKSILWTKWTWWTKWTFQRYRKK